MPGESREYPLRPGEKLEGRHLDLDSSQGGNTFIPLPRSGQFAESQGHTADSKIAKIVRNRLRQIMQDREDVGDVSEKERKIGMDIENRESDERRANHRSKIPSTIPRYCPNPTRSTDQKVIFVQIS